MGWRPASAFLLWFRCGASRKGPSVEATGAREPSPGPRPPHLEQLLASSDPATRRPRPLPHAHLTRSSSEHRRTPLLHAAGAPPHVRAGPAPRCWGPAFRLCHLPGPEGGTVGVGNRDSFPRGRSSPPEGSDLAEQVQAKWNWAKAGTKPVARTYHPHQDAQWYMLKRPVDAASSRGPPGEGGRLRFWGGSWLLPAAGLRPARGAEHVPGRGASVQEPKSLVIWPSGLRTASSLCLPEALEASR